jgi:hypothetical protein
VLRRLRHGESSDWYEQSLARYVAPDGRAPTDAPLELFLLHAPLFHGDEIEKRVAGDVDELMRREEHFDLLAWPAADKGEPVADRGVFGAPASVPLPEGSCRAMGCDTSSESCALC